MFIEKNAKHHITDQVFLYHVDNYKNIIKIKKLKDKVKRLKLELEMQPGSNYVESLEEHFYSLAD